MVGMLALRLGVTHKYFNLSGYRDGTEENHPLGVGPPASRWFFIGSSASLVFTGPAPRWTQC